jgi:hypothetical protein
MSWRPRLKKDEQDLIREYRGIRKAAIESGLDLKDG